MRSNKKEYHDHLKKKKKGVPNLSNLAHKQFWFDCFYDCRAGWTSAACIHWCLLPSSVCFCKAFKKLKHYRCIQETVFHTCKLGFFEQSKPLAKSSKAFQAGAWVAEGNNSDLCRKLQFPQSVGSFQEQGILNEPRALRTSQGEGSLVLKPSARTKQVV